MSSPSRSKRGSRRDVHIDVRVAGDAAARPAWPGPRMPDPLAVVDPGRDLDVELLRLDRAPVAVAGGAGRLDDGAGAEAGRAGLRAHELAEDAARDLLQLATARAGRARDALGARLGPVTLAGSQAAATSTSTLRSTPVKASASSIATATPTSPPRWRPPRFPGEEVVAEEGGEDVAQVREVEVGRRVAAAAQAGVAVAVVELRRSASESTSYASATARKRSCASAFAVHVGMELAREPAERLLDLARRARRQLE